MDRGGVRRFVDACYAGSSDRSAWIAELASALGPLVYPSQGALVSINARETGAIVDAAAWGPARELLPMITRATLPPDAIAAAFAPFTVTRLTRQFARKTMTGVPFWDQHCPMLVDSVGMCADDGNALLIASIPLDRLGSGGEVERRLLRLRRHFSAAYRGRVAEAGAIASDVVLDLEGRILHRGPESDRARPASRDLGSVGLLREAARAFDRERKGEAPTGSGEALWSELWRGGWHLIDAVDSDGRRMLLLRRVAEQRAPKALTELERRALYLARAGRSLKEIGFTLALPTSTTSDCIASGLRKLGLGSRLELVRALTVRPTSTRRRRQNSSDTTLPAAE